MSPKLYWCRHVCLVCRCMVSSCKAQGFRSMFKFYCR
ncbi:hypothetical protein NMG60_11015038 [Bertholletia excelsa]